MHLRIYIYIYRYIYIYIYIFFWSSYNFARWAWGLGSLETRFCGCRRPHAEYSPGWDSPFWTHRLYANYTRGTVSEQWPEIKTVREEGAWKSKGNGVHWDGLGLGPNFWGGLTDISNTTSSSSGHLEYTLIYSKYFLNIIKYVFFLILGSLFNTLE